MPILGIIGFKRYRIRCIIGTEPCEREREQDLLIDLKVEIDFTRAAHKDHLSDTVDYVSLAALCNEVAQRGCYQLIEKYATDLVHEVQKKFAIKSVWVRVEKPQAIPEAECAFVEFQQENSGLR